MVARTLVVGLLALLALAGNHAVAHETVKIGLIGCNMDPASWSDK